MSSAERLLALFSGCEIGHGTYTREVFSPGKKKSEIKASARTLREPATADLWQQHLDGKRPLGIIPIRTDATCFWGVIDVDMYDLSHSDIARRLEATELPLLVCRSKSGGAHLFLFTSEPVLASEMMHKLTELAAYLGYSGSEIFPKQTQLLLDRGDLGNWLNMPYYDAESGTRYCVSSRGTGLTVEEFLDKAEAARLPRSKFMSLRPKVRQVAARPVQGGSEGEDLEGGPPCLQHLAAVGVAEGGRNNALFAYGVLARKKFPERWEEVLERWNQEFFSPALSRDEVGAVVRSLRKKETYSYKCKDQPIVSHCDAALCKTRKHGVQQGASPNITAISILDTDPPTYFVSLGDDGTVECTVDQLLSPRLFRTASLSHMKDKFTPMYKQEDWDAKVRQMLASAVRIDVPEEVSRKGAFMEMLIDFLTDRNIAQTLDEVDMKRPFLDDETGFYMFRLDGFREFLKNQKFEETSMAWVTARLRDVGCTNGYYNRRRRKGNLWKIEVSKIQFNDVPYDTPRPPGSPI